MVNSSSEVKEIKLPENRLSHLWARHLRLNFVGTAFKKWEGLCVCITDFLPFNNQNQIIYNLTPIIYNLVLIIYKKNWIIFIKRTKARTRLYIIEVGLCIKKGGTRKRGQNLAYV